MEPMELTNFHLGRSQKEQLRARALARGTNVAEEIRNAVDAYLSGVTAEELELLDAATRQAAVDIAEMTALLDGANARAEAVLAELDRLGGVARPAPAVAAAGRAPAAASRRVAGRAKAGRP
jgi:hypothetical protein